LVEKNDKLIVSRTNLNKDFNYYSLVMKNPLTKSTSLEIEIIGLH